MAKDTEKLIRQLSLISYLMAERRPVTAADIRRDVEGYSTMNEEAFARRFYADRSELEALGIQLRIERPSDGQTEQELYSLPPENFYLPPVEFTDKELGALGTALSLLDGEFAYSEPLRLALQQLTWGRPRPLEGAGEQTVALAIAGSAGGQELSQRLAKVEAAIFRRKTITFEYRTLARDEVQKRKVDPYQLLFQGGLFYLVGYSHEREATRIFRLSRIESKISYASKSEHDFDRPDDFDPREYADRAPWQLGDIDKQAQIAVDERLAWLVERHFGRFGEIEARSDGGIVLTVGYSNSRLLISWLLGLGRHVAAQSPPELEAELHQRLELIAEQHAALPKLAAEVEPSHRKSETPDSPRESESAIRPERIARLVTLAGILVGAGRANETLPADELCAQLKLTREELDEDLSVLNVVNFGGGSYVLYAEINAEGEIEVDPEPYSDSFERPVRLLPVEAKALVAAIDLIGDHLPDRTLSSAREKVVTALGEDPSETGLHVAPSPADDSDLATLLAKQIERRQITSLEYYKETDDQFSTREVEPHGLIRGREGWYLIAFDRDRNAPRHFRLDRIKQATPQGGTFELREEVDPQADIEDWPRTGEMSGAERAKVWIAPARARWLREERTVLSEHADGSVVIELGYGSRNWLLREIFKEAGDAVLLEPAELREAVQQEAQQLIELRGNLAGATA